MAAVVEQPLSATQKTCRVLASLADPRVSRLTDIAAATHLDVSTALRILKELESEGFVERDPESKRYVLGTQVYAMHRAMINGIDLVALARPSLIRLARRFGDTVILSAPTGWESVCLDQCFGDYPIRANYLDVGSRRPLGVGAGSLALLAALPEAEVRAIRPLVDERLAERYPRYATSVMTSRFDAARRAGYAMLLDVVVEKMGGIGAAILGPNGAPLGALSIAALNERIESRELALADALRNEVQAIARAWLPEHLA